MKRFTPMLAIDGTNAGVRFPVAMEPKLDGIRMIAVVKNGVVSLLSRSGKSLDHLKGIGVTAYWPQKSSNAASSNTSLFKRCGLFPCDFFGGQPTCNRTKAGIT